MGELGLTHDRSEDDELHPRLRLLVVGDSVFSRNLVLNSLRVNHMTDVEIASSFQEGFMQVGKGHFDIVIIDNKTDPKPGIELTNLIRNGHNVKDPKIPVIMLSDNVDQDVVREASEAGVTGFLVKPVSANKLFKHIKHIIGSSHELAGALAKRSLQSSETLNTLRIREVSRRFSLGDIRIIVGNAKTMIRDGIKGGLSRYGYAVVETAESIEQMRSAFAKGGVAPDLMICDAGLPGGSFRDMIHDLRYRELGEDPFIGVMAISHASTRDTVQKLLDTGVDALMTNPVSAMDIHERIIDLIENRKPFIVTTDYIGPDRRRQSRPDAQLIERIDIPSAMRDKALSRYNARAHFERVKQTFRTVNRQKVERHAFQIGYLVERIVPALMENAAEDETLTMINRLAWVCEDLARRTVGTPYAKAKALGQEMADTVNAIRKDPSAADRALIQRLPRIAVAVGDICLRAGPKSGAPEQAAPG